MERGRRKKKDNIKKKGVETRKEREEKSLYMFKPLRLLENLRLMQ